MVKLQLQLELASSAGSTEFTTFDSNDIYTYMKYLLILYIIDHNHSESTFATYGLISRTETNKPPLKEAVRPGENQGVW